MKLSLIGTNGMDVKIISCTRGSREDTMLYKSLVDTKYADSVNWFEFNSRSMSSCYNEVIDYYRHEEVLDMPILLFVHDDVCIDDMAFDKKLVEYSESFDLMGVVGSKVIDTRARTIAWHLTPPETLYGAVQHVDGSKYWMTDFSKGKRIPEAVATLDGLFIAMTSTSYQKIQFDECFMWDFYDMRLCVDAYQNGLSTGVVPISITHSSMGEGINGDNYKKAQQLFLDNLEKGR